MAVVWHSSLILELDSKIERIQKAAVRVNMGERYTTYRVPINYRRKVDDSEGH